MTEFESLKSKVGKFSLANKKLLVPEMGRTVSHLIGATMRSFGVDAQVMETYKGLKLGKQYTSGKECFPCQVTLGDVLYHLEREKERLGEAFRAENYLYFMAESGGPCRFGMYNKLHRIVMDSMDGFSKTRITSISADDSYALGGLMAPEVRTHFRRSAYVGLVIGDILDRMLWRTRPYEQEAGIAEDYLEKALSVMCQEMETHGRKKRFHRILSTLDKSEHPAQTAHRHGRRNLLAQSPTIKPGSYQTPGKPRRGGGKRLYCRVDKLCLVRKYAQGKKRGHFCPQGTKSQKSSALFSRLAEKPH
jgi:hypothetical protein